MITFEDTRRITEQVTITLEIDDKNTVTYTIRIYAQDLCTILYGGFVPEEIVWGFIPYDQVNDIYHSLTTVMRDRSHFHFMTVTPTVRNSLIEAFKHLPDLGIVN